MSFFTTEALPVLGGMFFNRLGGAVENEVLVEANLEVRIQRIALFQEYFENGDTQEVAVTLDELNIKNFKPEVSK